MCLRKITQGKLEVLLRKHKLWLMNEPGGERADLYGADLYGADLSYADLSCVNLSYVNLSYADLSGTNLSYADLHGADLHGAKLSGTNLYNANLYNANLSCVNISGAKRINYPLACPEKGSFIAFKKVRGDYIVELEIPADALRSSSTTRKCRCSHAKVISITNVDGTDAEVDEVYSTYDKTFGYRVGETVKVDNFDTNRWNECAPGIHFFITRQEAVDY